MHRPQKNKDVDLEKQLKELVRRKANQAAANAVASDGAQAEEEISSLRKLSQLVKTFSRAQPPTPRKRWPVILILIGTLLCVSVLVFSHVWRTAIEMDVALSEVSFVLSEEQTLTSPFQLSALGVSGFNRLELPELKQRDLYESLTESEGDKQVLLSLSSSGKSGSISLGSVILPAGSRVWLRRNEGPRQYRLSVKADSTQELRTEVNGTVKVSTSNAPSEILELMSPRAFVFEFGPGELDLDLTLPGEDAVSLAPNLAIKDPHFLSLEEIVDTEHTLVRKIPTILSGSIYYSALDGQQRQLREGEGLRLTGCEGELRRIEIMTKGLRFNFVGKVSGMEKGEGAYKSNIMPTVLEWIRANHGWTLLWGTTLYLFGLVLGAIRWWTDVS